MSPQPATSRRVARAGARLNAVQALYQMDVAATPTTEVFAEFESHWIGREVEGVAHPEAEVAFFRDLVEGVVREQRRIDPLIDDTLSGGWPLRRVEAVLRALLRAGCYELMPGRIFLPGLLCRNMLTSQARSSKGTRPRWLTRCSTPLLASCVPLSSPGRAAAEMAIEPKPRPDPAAAPAKSSSATAKPDLLRLGNVRQDPGHPHLSHQDLSRQDRERTPAKPAAADGANSNPSKSNLTKPDLAEHDPAKPAPAARSSSGEPSVPVDLGSFTFELSPFDLGPLDFTVGKTPADAGAAPAESPPVPPRRRRPSRRRPPSGTPRRTVRDCRAQGSRRTQDAGQTRGAAIGAPRPAGAGRASPSAVRARRAAAAQGEIGRCGVAAGRSGPDDVDLGHAQMGRVQLGRHRLDRDPADGVAAGRRRARRIGRR